MNKKMIPLPQNMAAINWTFSKTFESIQIHFHLKTDLTTIKKGVYCQFYDGYINGHGMYFGIQINVAEPQKGLTGNAVVFSQWGTADEKKIRISKGGFIENASHEGQFAGVRKHYLFKPSNYLIKLLKQKLKMKVTGTH